MRLFIAINFASRDRVRMERSAKRMREAELPVRWVEAEHIHLTLKFLGDVRPDRLEEVKHAVSRVADKTQPLVLRLGGAGAFPTTRRPRLIWLGAEATPELRCLKHDVEWELSPLGFERELRAFHPHVTLGRARSDARAGDFRGFDEMVAGMNFRAEIPVRSIDLMESTLSARGAQYRKLLAARLGHAMDVAARAGG
jgi:RNA 2',3'-cyclic 3'-phosphodiesterase